MMLMKNSVELFKSKLELAKDGIGKSEANWDYPVLGTERKKNEEKWTVLQSST